MPRLAQRSLALFDRLSDRYRRALDAVLARQPATLVVFALTVALTGVLFVVIPKGLFPVQDTGQLQAIVMSEQGVSFGRAAELAEQVAAALLGDPDVESLSVNVGVDGKNPNGVSIAEVSLPGVRRPTTCQAPVSEDGPVGGRAPS